MEAGVDGFVLHVPDFLGTCGVARIVADSPCRCFGDKGDVEDITEGTIPAHAVDSSEASWLTYTVLPADIISTVEFDHTGNYLATGDKGGRVVLFERNETVSEVAIFGGQRS
jgi:hypothetical protein